MKTIPVHDAVGTVLCHDITEIIPGKFKGRAFKKGHVIREEDIPRLLDIGKEHLYVWELDENTLHENEAAQRIAKAAAGPGIVLSDPVEGKVELRAERAGLLKINTAALASINDVDEVVLASIHSNQLVVAGRVVAGCRVVPLVIDTAKVMRAETLGMENAPVFEVKPLPAMKVGIVTTGSEVYHGRIQDKFGPVLRDKLAALGSEVLRQIFVNDNADMIATAIQSLVQEGAGMIAVTGGMSVDPDDLTPSGIRAAGGRVVVYGAPVLPGSMFMLAYLGKVPVVGLPGCVMYHRTTIFDLIVPRLLAGEEINRADVSALAHGGLCSVCSECRYPDCAFGKGN
ncbi:MAG TPA: molybdopterin-binding protein [Dissulfurispiraceae bacterium]|nr:molybdopterin-binding protein [Dissulfurispiraceae bacterium]